MSFNWAGYLRVAEESAILAKTSAAGADCWRRTSISRAYYAAFHAAAECAESRNKGLLQQAGADHHRVIKHFKNATRTDTRNIGFELERLYDNRLRADYSPVMGGLDEECADSLEMAKDILGRVESLCRK